jgi:nucleotide-binding universal stress UspA family protein
MKVLVVTNDQTENDPAYGFSEFLMKRSEDSFTILSIVNKSTDKKNKFTHPAAKSSKIPQIEAKIRYGRFYEQVLFELNEGNYDLLIIADRRPKYLPARIYWGSTAVRLAEEAPCSVLIVRGKKRVIKRILLCDSGMGSSSILSRLVLNLANLIEGDEDVTILHVMSQISAGPGVDGKHLREDADGLIADHTPEGEVLAHDIELLEKPGIHPSPKVRHGFVVEEILDEARSIDYDLVIIGAHPQTGTLHYLLENITHRILKEIDRSILVVRLNNQKSQIETS